MEASEVSTETNSGQNREDVAGAHTVSRWNPSSRANRQGWAKRLGKKTGLLFKGWSPKNPLSLLQKVLLAEAEGHLTRSQPLPLSFPSLFWSLFSSSVGEGINNRSVFISFIPQNCRDGEQWGLKKDNPLNESWASQTLWDGPRS